MRGKDLLECMEYIDDTLIEEALNPAGSPHNKNSMVKNWSLAAACVIMLCIFATAFWSHQNSKKLSIQKSQILRSRWTVYRMMRGILACRQITTPAVRWHNPLQQTPI